MKIKYNIEKSINDELLLIKFNFHLPPLSIKNALNFRINNIQHHSGERKLDPLIPDSLHTHSVTAADFNQNIEINFYFNIKNIINIKNITFGFCNELVYWHKDTFITIDVQETGGPKKIISAPIINKPNFMPENDNKLVKHDIKKICILSTWNIKCGISQYCKNFYNALLQHDCEVIVVDNNSAYDDIYNLITKFNYNIFIIQYEPAIVKDINRLTECINKLKLFNPNIKVYFIVHSENPNLHKLDGKINGFIFHKNNKLVFNHTKCHIIPMGVPIFNPEHDKMLYRNKYNINNDKFIISTIGFMFKWKNHALFLEKMLKYLNKYDDIIIQMMTSFHSLNNECVAECDKIKKVISVNHIQDKVIHITDYVTQKELNERLYLSDIGFLWAGMETTSSSASLKEFVSSRLPLVKTNSNHHHDVSVGCITTDKDMHKLVEKIIELYNNKNRLTFLRLEMEEFYNNVNYDKTIIKFIDIFNS